MLKVAQKTQAIGQRMMPLSLNKHSSRKLTNSINQQFVSYFADFDKKLQRIRSSCCEIPSSSH